MRRPTKRQLRVESLESKLLLSTLVAESEPNNTRGTADVFSLDPADGRAQLNGRINRADDQDFFRFVATETGAMSIRVVSGTALTGKIMVENANRVELFESEPHDGINEGTFNVVAGQTYRIRMRGADHTAGRYTVQLGTGSEEPGGGGGGGEPGNQFNEDEPNGDRGTADAFSLGADGVIELRGTSTSDDDKDYFTFVPTRSGTLTLTVNRVSGAFAKLQLENAQGNQILDINPNEGPNTRTIQVTAGSRLFLRMRSPDDRSAAYMTRIALS